VYCVYCVARTTNIKCCLPSGNEREMFVFRVPVLTDGAERPRREDGVRILNVEQTKLV